ncbi:MAG: hypothetical protein V4558_08735 [Gemmatimonadota bacterium]
MSRFGLLLALVLVGAATVTPLQAQRPAPVGLVAPRRPPVALTREFAVAHGSGKATARPVIIAYAIGVALVGAIAFSPHEGSPHTLGEKLVLTFLGGAGVAIPITVIAILLGAR